MRSMRALLFGLSVSLLFACADFSFIEAPSAGSAGPSLFAYATNAGALVAEIHPPGHELHFEEARDDVPTFLWLEYDESLEVLGLELGPIEPRGIEEESRSPPVPARSFASAAGGAFVEIDDDERNAHPIWRALRLPPFDPLLCLSRGGCPSDDRCRLDCSPPERAPPTIDLPRFICPVGWTSGPLGDLSPAELTADPRLSSFEICRPTFPATTCPPGFVAFGDSPSCEALGDCTEEWPRSLPVNTIFVRAGAPSGGDGSMNAPFARISEARSAAPNAAHLALHGALELDASISFTGTVAASIRGSCASRDRLLWHTPQSISLPDAGELALSGLRVEVAVESAPLLPFRVQDGQRLVMEAVEIESVATEPIIVARRASVHLRDVRLSIRNDRVRVVQIEGPSVFHAARAVLEGGHGQVVLVFPDTGGPSAEVVLDRVSLRGPGQGLFATRANVRATDLAIFARAPFALVESELSLTNGYAQLTPPASPNEPMDTPVLFRGDSEVRGFAVEPAPGVSSPNYQVVFDSGAARIWDVVLDARGFQGGALLESSPCEGLRILARGALDANMNIRTSSATLSQLSAFGGASGLQLSSTDSVDAHHEVTDVHASGFGNYGVRDVPPGLGSLILRRVWTHAGAGYGVSLRSTSDSRLEDAHIEDVEAGGGEIARRGVGLDLRVSAVANHVSIRRCERAGIVYELGARPQLRSFDVREVPAVVVTEDPAADRLERWQDWFVCGAEAFLLDLSDRPRSSRRPIDCEE